MLNNDFLYTLPTVFVIGNEYEILINLKKYGICFVKIGDKLYYEENSGVLPSERTVVKIRVPQSVLDAAQGYEIVFRQTNERKAYWSTFLAPEVENFTFKPIKKTENINVYYLSDVHYEFELAKRVGNYFGEDVDLYVINGDIGEVESVQDYLDVCKFVGDLAGGGVPVLFPRGNHDTRGHLAELFTDYFPCNGKKTYYTFEVGCLGGLVLDCGEDKEDHRDEYDSSTDTPIEYLGVNRFTAYRQAQLEFLKGVTLDKSRINLAVSHVCPAMVTRKPGGVFDIDKELYADWCKELDRIAPDLMLCGHYHDAYILDSGDPRNLNPHAYPVAVCAKVKYSKEEKQLWGAAIVLNKGSADISFTDEEHRVLERHILKL